MITVGARDDIEDVLENTHISIKVLGAGGAGNNALRSLGSLGVAGAELIAANTDAQDLLKTPADKKIILGRMMTRGLGAGNNPGVGEVAAKESIESIKTAIEGAHLLFVIGGLGGGTGTGSIPVICQQAREQNILTVAVVSLPFAMEGQRRWNNAMEGLRKLERSTDSIILIPNDKLMQHAEDMALTQAFMLADTITAEAIKGIVELITRPGVINLDFADLRTILRDSGVCVIGSGESDTQNRSIEAADIAMHNPLIDANLRGAKGCLINVIGGPDMTLSEAQKVVHEARKVLDDDARIIWGTQLDPTMEGKLKVLLILTGLSSRAIIDSKAEDGFVDLEDI